MFRIAAGIALACIGFVLGRYTESPEIVQNKVLRESGYKYISPVLLCNSNNDQSTKEDVALSKQFAEYASKVYRESKDDISVYLINLDATKWAGVNQNEPFSPASMLKVPTMLAILKYSELHPEFLNTKIYYNGTFDDNKMQFYKPVEKIQPGKLYTISSLLKYMIAHSDNNATRLLNTSIDNDSQASIYIGLGIQLPENALDFMSARTYSMFLRLLYNSTYLTRKSSEMALQLMADSTFKDGLGAGVPEGVNVSHKFGERQIFNQDGSLEEKELHDCGIVYGSHKYIICVMTKGLDFTKLSGYIKDVSSIAYNYISAEI